jgi:hypothetical protein
MRERLQVRPICRSTSPTAANALSSRHGGWGRIGRTPRSQGRAAAPYPQVAASPRQPAHRRRPEPDVINRSEIEAGDAERVAHPHLSDRLVARALA